MKEIKLYKFYRRKYGTEQRWDAMEFDAIKPGILQFPVHRESFYCFILVEDGETIISVNGVQNTVGPKTVICGLPGRYGSGKRIRTSGEKSLYSSQTSLCLL